ncbi:PAS domain S-box-containing protein [Crossiella equi]|uniref:histidine kinase n=3 Tax=Crossiella equi TaxID=130796 RepID=A0ABS5ARZ4_9PSEU|nr:SpoIIE family protein phosphatase [Crossiella equi]MBP2479330.1 PAS domain S-box-containing protein [Crossiella equi]
MATASADVFAADREVGPDLAAVDWSATPLGPPAHWPQSLRTAVSILLSSRFPMWLAWGEQLTFFCNAAYRRDTLGRKYPWALGRPAPEVWAEVWDDVAPRIQSVLTTGEATWDEGLLLLLERSGYPEETYHTFSYSPLRDDSGAVVGMLCVVSEDTERVIAERRMATLRDLGSDPSAVRTEQEALDFATRQLARNRRDFPFTLTYLLQDNGSARLAGSSGVTDPQLFPATRWPAAGGEVALADPALPTGDWPEPPVRALVVPLRPRGGAPYGFLVAGLNRYRDLDEEYRGFVGLVAGHLATGIAVARNYQDQQRRAEQLAELDRAKTAFFANVSHEFRTPLTLIMGPVAELRDRLAGTEPQLSAELASVHRNGLRLGKLVNTLLDFSRIEAGRMGASYAPADLSAVTAELASVFRSAITQAGLAFEVDCPPLPQPVHLDRGMWEKVVLNLLSNALKFTFDGTIRVSVADGGQEAVVTVADTGTGVPPGELPRLFERFHRIENARARSHEGSGIGLALVRELVGLHGGTITAASTLGEGTRFTIHLPYGSAHLPESAMAATAVPGSAAESYVQEALRWLPREPAAPAPETPAAATVLVADDNTDMREYLTRLLQGAGYAVHAVTDGSAALEAARTRTPDLVVSDVMMPGLSGLALVAALRADPRTAAVPVLLLSARAGQEAAIEGLTAGADDYLVKPFAAADLLARVRANVALARLRDHHARWRTALIDSLQEAFFVCTEDGTVVEINTAFADILGYGPDGLPYRPVHPWWPDVRTSPDAHRLVAGAFRELISRDRGTATVPVRHRDGHLVWVSVLFNTARDPDSGQSVVVGTFRDVTAEHYTIQREAALAALGLRLSQAGSLAEALSGALAELRQLWHSGQALAVLFPERGRPAVNGTGPAHSWEELDPVLRALLLAQRERPVLSPASHPGAGTGVTLEHPEGLLVLWLDSDGNRPFTAQDEVLLSLLAGHLAQGLARAHQIDQQRETALELQRAILGPEKLPGGFAVRYEPAARPLEIGGDWYDTVDLPHGRIGIVVGDCVGRGLKAAAVMGQLRSACRALLLQGTGPARVLMALDRFAADLPGAMCTTVFCGTLDPVTGVLTYSSAGHPPAVLVAPDGATELLARAGSIPLGVRTGLTRPEAECALAPRATLLMYTDGLVERRGQPLTDGIRQAAELVRADLSTGLDELATRLMDGLAPDGADDDIALLLYRHPAPLAATFPAAPAQLARMRAALRTWLGQCDLPELTVQNVLVAAGEAFGNAVEHAYRGRAPGEVRLRAQARGHELELTVADSGGWQTPRPEDNPHRGRGLGMMRTLADHAEITHGPDGTTVTLLMRIG